MLPHHAMRMGVPVNRLGVSTFIVPIDFPESDGTPVDGALAPVEGHPRPDLSRPGLGVELKWADAERYAV